MAVRKFVYNSFFVSNRPVLSELPSYFDISLPVKKPLKYLHANASNRVQGAFNVSWYRKRHNHSCCVFINDSEFLNVSISRYIFYLVGIDTARNRLKILLWFFLCNFLSISFPTTLRPLCLFRTHNNNNNSLSLCTLTLHITPCERMRGDFSVCRQSHTAGTLAVSSSSTVKWTV